MLLLVHLLLLPRRTAPDQGLAAPLSTLLALVAGNENMLPDRKSAGQCSMIFTDSEQAMVQRTYATVSRKYALNALRCQVTEEIHANKNTKYVVKCSKRWSWAPSNSTPWNTHAAAFRSSCCLRASARATTSNDGQSLHP
jgi:hypothetical protein